MRCKPFFFLFCHPGSHGKNVAPAFAFARNCCPCNIADVFSTTDYAEPPSWFLWPNFCSFCFPSIFRSSTGCPAPPYNRYLVLSPSFLSRPLASKNESFSFFPSRPNCSICSIASARNNVASTHFADEVSPAHRVLPFPEFPGGIWAQPPTNGHGEAVA